MVVVLMLLMDIDSLKQVLYMAIDREDFNTAYKISTELDTLIVEYYKTSYKYN
jgi:hypothetical protein